MKEKYSIEEILDAIDEIQNIEKKMNSNTDLIDNFPSRKKSNIPINTLKLIEEAEKKIISK